MKWKEEKKRKKRGEPDSHPCRHQAHWLPSEEIEKQAKEAEAAAGKKGAPGLSGRALFTYDPTLFVDDADAAADDGALIFGVLYLGINVASSPQIMSSMETKAGNRRSTKTLWHKPPVHLKKTCSWRRETSQMRTIKCVRLCNMHAVDPRPHMPMREQ